MARLLALCLSLAFVAIVAGQEPTTPTPQLPFDPCPFCMTATGMLETQLKAMENATQTIGATLAQACGTAGPAEGACMLFVRQYGGLFAYGFSVADFSLEGFCKGVFFCAPPTYQMMTQNGIFETACNICKQTMGTILDALTSDQVVGQAQKRIEQICSAPMVDTEECLKTFGGALLQAMQTTKGLLDPEQFCTMVGPCAMAKPSPVPSPEAGPATETIKLPVA